MAEEWQAKEWGHAPISIIPANHFFARWLTVGRRRVSRKAAKAQRKSSLGSRSGTVIMLEHEPAHYPMALGDRRPTQNTKSKQVDGYATLRACRFAPRPSIAVIHGTKCDAHRAPLQSLAIRPWSVWQRSGGWWNCTRSWAAGLEREGGGSFAAGLSAPLRFHIAHDDDEKTMGRGFPPLIGSQSASADWSPFPRRGP